MSKISIQYFETPYGELILGSYGTKLCLADWRERKQRQRIDSRLHQYLNAEYIEQDTEILKKTRNQLDEYFSHKRKDFDIPLLILGTNFQKTVWKGLANIPYGKTLCYGELSKKIGNEKAVRAVANAVGANALSILTPCHRIIGTDGSLTGYAGGLDAKRRLLSLESNLITL